MLAEPENLSILSSDFRSVGRARVSDLGASQRPWTKTTDSIRPVLSIVLATLNERDNLPPLIARIKTLNLPPWEVIVIDDGSDDGTQEYLATLSRDDPRIRPLFHNGRRTLLPAHCEAIEAARGSFIIVMDADLQHPPETLVPIFQDLEKGASLVVASRYASHGSAGDRSTYRMVVSRTAELIARVLLKDVRSLSDPLSGFYGFRSEVFVPLSPGCTGYELLPFVKIMSRGRLVREVPYRFQPRRNGYSKIVVRNLTFIRFFVTEILQASRFGRAWEVHDRYPGTSKAAAAD